jgi:nucleoside-diphosphate-sugar epimerase
LDNAFSPADCVIHCAARSGDWGRYKDFYETNVVGTRNVIEACKRHNIKRILFISTPSIYFTGKDRFNISESEPLPIKQTTHYSKTKLSAETELLALQQEGHKVIIFRPRAVYGPYDNTFVPRILRLAEKKQMPLINNGRAMIDITCVDNLVDAVRKSLSASDNAWNEAYNISNGAPISVKDWFSQVLDVFDRPFNPKNVPESLAKAMASIMEFAGNLPLVSKQPSMTRFSVGYMAKSMTMNIDKAKQKLNYLPRVGNQQGFEKYAKWYHSIFGN